MSNILATELLRELEAEAPSTRKCLERIPENLFKWKPHEKSTEMGNLAFIVSDIPRWITTMVKATELDFVTFKHEPAKDTSDLLKFFDEHMKSSSAALAKITDEELKQDFQLKAGGQLVYTASKLDNISSSIRHLAHHRGQLTVYMRLKDLPVPAIYGPTADDKSF